MGFRKRWPGLVASLLESLYATAAAGERTAACRGSLLVALRRLFFFCLGGTRTMLACRVRLETPARVLRFL